MVSQMVRLQAHPRSVLGKEVKRLRRQALTPVHLYGSGVSSMALQVDSTILKNTLAQVGRSRPVSLEMEGQETPYITFVRDIQFHPLDSSVLHVDFLSVEVSATIEVEVPISLAGEAPAARMLGGSLIQMLNSVRVQASPLEVPAGISVAVSHLDDFAKSIRVADLQVPAGATIMTEPHQLVARVTPPVAAEAEAVPEEAPEAEPEAEAEGEAGEEAPA